TIEDELVVAADLVHVEEAAAVRHRLLRDHPPPQVGLVGREGTGRDVDEQVDVLIGQLLDRIAVVEPARPEVAVVPDVLADRHAEPRALEDDRLDGGGRLEVAVLVEDVVGRQQRLRAARHDPPATAERRGVVQALTRRARVAVDEARQDRRPVGTERRQAIELLEVQVDEALVPQQVARRIAGRRQLGEDDEVGAVRARVLDGGRHLREVVVEGPDGEVQLSQQEAHAGVDILPARPTNPYPVGARSASTTAGGRTDGPEGRLARKLHYLQAEARGGRSDGSSTGSNRGGNAAGYALQPGEHRVRPGAGHCSGGGRGAARRQHPARALVPAATSVARRCDALRSARRHEWRLTLRQ